MEDKEHVSTLESIMPEGWLDSEYNTEPLKKSKPSEPKIKKPILERLGIQKPKV